VTQTRWEPDSIPSPPRDQRPTGLRPGGVAAGPTRHTVARGETFATIAQLYYGSARYDKALWWVNRGMVAWPERLTAGDLIIIPRVDQLDGSLIRPMRSKSTTAPIPASAPSALLTSAANREAVLNLPASSEAQIEPRRGAIGRDPDDAGNDPPGSSRRTSNPRPSRVPPVHVVRPYETLRSIARDRLGNSGRANEIIELNQGRLPANQQLTPGQRLLLPDDARPLSPAP